VFNRVFIGIGSNIDPARNVLHAMQLLSNKMVISGVSTFYLTTAIGHRDQNPYFNGVCVGLTELDPTKFHQSILRDVEQQLGRQRSADRYAPRSIDLDLLLHGQSVLDSSELTIPSPDIWQRNFVCLPLLELDSSLSMPDSGIHLSDLASQLNSSGMTPLLPFTNQLKEALRL
jgi:2-amino-4-hydroxy-6-hydroxymethyldihydropteridine diphosphokinase